MALYNAPMTTRITTRFDALKAEGRAGLVTFTMAGDPDRGTALAILRALPAAGADVIELGMPFTDPMADGPAIQAAGLRALKGGATLAGTLDLVRAFREEDADTPLRVDRVFALLTMSVGALVVGTLAFLVTRSRIYLSHFMG